MDIASVVHIIVYLIVVGIILGLLLYLVNISPVPEPWKGWLFSFHLRSVLSRSQGPKRVSLWQRHAACY